MPSRSQSRSFSRGRAAKRYRARSSSVGSGMYSLARGSRSRSLSRRSIGVLHKARPMISLNTHSYSRWTEPETTNYNSQGLPLDFTFKFADIIASTEFQTLYDQFKIDYVMVHIQLVNNPDAAIAPNNDPAAVNNSTNFYPKLWYIRDFDGGSSETLSSIKERQGVKYMVMRPNATLKVKIRPMVAVQTYRTATTTGYGPKRMFLDFVNGTEVPHYGLKCVFDTLGFNPPDTQPYKLRHEIKYYFTCKNVR